MDHFLEETFGILGVQRVGLVRADSGFCSEKMMGYFETKRVPYIVAARFHGGLKAAVRGARWLRLKDGVEVCETWPTFSMRGGKERRLILVRKELGRLPRSTGHQLEIWEDEALDARYRYRAYSSSLELSAEVVWCLNRDREDAEPSGGRSPKGAAFCPQGSTEECWQNRIKELKNDFGIEGFQLKNFWGTEAALRFAIMACKLMSLFRRLVLEAAKQPALATLRVKCFALGAWISTHARKRVLKIALASKKGPGSMVSSQTPTPSLPLSLSSTRPDANFGMK